MKSKKSSFSVEGRKSLLTNADNLPTLSLNRFTPITPNRQTETASSRVATTSDRQTETASSRVATTSDRNYNRR